MEALEPETFYRILLFAANAKGRSEPTVIDDVHLEGPVKYTGKFLLPGARLYSNCPLLCLFSSRPGTVNSLEIDLSPFLLGLAVTAAALFVFGCFVLVALYRRNNNK